MIKPIVVRIVCDDCSTKKQAIDKYAHPINFAEDGPLYFNKATKTQAQVYKCPNCNRSITLMINEDQ